MSGGEASSFPVIIFIFIFLISSLPPTVQPNPDPRCYPSASPSASFPASPLFSRRGSHRALHTPPPGATLINDRGRGWVEIAHVVSSRKQNDFSTAGCSGSGGRRRK